MTERFAKLTPRQVQCLRLVADLKDTQQIAHILGLSPNTVDSYLSDATKALGASNRRHAALMLRDFEKTSVPEKLGYDFARPDDPPEHPASVSSQSEGEPAGGEAEVTAVREMPRAYETYSNELQALSWAPLPGAERRPSSIPPLRRIVLIFALVVGLGAGAGIAILAVAGAIVVSERTRP